ncbi:MAG: outer membrane protein assembly factor BamC [Moraxellaceae bacterium]|nr:MAG: outer membrane protein assembly factor BamC [Moraxellaceae bacterium]
MLYRVGLVLGVSLLTLVVTPGCSRLSVDNHSLDYKQATVLPPLQLPAGQTRPMTAIYPAPAISPAAMDAAPNFANKKGNRFEMPQPQNNSVMTAANDNVGIGAPSRPVLVTDGNGYPLLKIEGDANRIWDLLTATLSVANITVVDRNQTAGWIAIKADNRTVYLRLNRAGTITTITVQDDKNALIDKNIASDVLVQLNQNWPA